MRKQGRIFVLTLSMFVSFFIAKESLAAGPTYLGSSSKIPSVWTKENSPYVIKGYLTTYNPIIIEAGVVVKFAKSSGIFAYSKITAIGTAKEKIIFTSIKDDEHGGDTNGDGNLSLPAPGNWFSIIFYQNSSGIFDNCGIYFGSPANSVDGSLHIVTKDEFILRNSEIKNSHNMGLMIDKGAKPIIENNIISNNHIGVLLWPEQERLTDVKDVVKVQNNIISDNVHGAVIMDIPTRIRMDMRNNWWGDKSGPYYKHKNFGDDNLNGLGNEISSDGIMFDPWLEKDPTIEDVGCQENCYSNVMFLPGIKASKLYKKGVLGTEDQLWPPNYFGNDLEQLQLDDDGKSIENVYTREALEEVGVPVVGGNIYKTFLGKLAGMKEGETINDYGVFAYDWRQNVEDIAKNGTPHEDNIKSAISQIESLAETSKSEKVTIVAHSNGGLLAKAIMMELEKKGLADKVDKIMLVGTPQMGTPLSVLSLLYGYDESALLGTLISREDARALAQNMPGVYGLLPSSEYFNRMENPFINFSSQNTRYKNFSDAYGEHISNPQEFFDFLAGNEGRMKPDSAEVEKENKLNETLLAQASQMHDRLDNWTPPQGVKVIQLAGWGLDTVSGVKYTEKEKYDCYAADSKIPSCIGIGEYEPIYEPEFTVDGDEVVVAPSALMMSENENVEKFWVDLHEYNDQAFKLSRYHSDLLEVDAVKELLENIIKNTSTSNLIPEYIKEDRPSDYNNAKPELRMSLYSPLDIHLYDEKGNHTGPKKITVDGYEKTVFEEGIPNSYYYQFGDRKYVGFQEDQNIKVIMDGYALGTYTLRLEEVQISNEGETLLTKKEFLNLPTTENTKVEFNVTASGLAEMSNLAADLDGDGKNEYELSGKVGEKIELPVTLEMISGNIDHLAKLGYIKNEKTQEFLQVKMKELMHVEEMVQKMDKKENNNPYENQIKLFDKKISDLIAFVAGKFNDDMTSIASDVLIRNLKSVKIELN